MVGCVIARGDRIIGEGFHRRFGGPHAEIEALRECKSNPRGATVYVTLEPCCHTGKTPPCVDALIDARVKRVVVASKDPNPAVNGRGIRRLRSAGIEVSVGVGTSEAAELLAPFATLIKLGRPYVIAKWAQSLDGRLTTPPGSSPWISCERSRRWVHRLRARVDTILVGVGTALADDPMLTARDVTVRRVATRVVLDRRLRVRESSKLVATANTTPTCLFTTRQAAQTPKAARLSRKGVEVIACGSRGENVSLESCLRLLGKRGVTNLLIEGGPTVLTSFLRADLVDEACVFVAPRLIGPDRRRPGVAPTTRVGARLDPVTSRTTRSGSDVLFRLRLTTPP
jgi:diaminohydroxyphosphoribosylaminopyrimidine deaminase/5-amino-6-(5-phosphoribosylamino)uracil reductase